MNITWTGVVIIGLIVVYHLVTKTDTFLTALANLKDRFISLATSQTTKDTSAVLSSGTRDEPNRTSPQDHDSENPEKASRRFRKAYRSIRKENDAFLYRLRSLEEQKRKWRSHKNIPVSAAQERVAREYHTFVAAKVADFDLELPAFRSIRDTNTLCSRLEGFAKAADIGGARRYLEVFADSTGIDW